MDMQQEVDKILDKWLGDIISEDSLHALSDQINQLEYKDFGTIVRVVNNHLGYDLTSDGEFDGVAMELEELFEDAEYEDD